MPANTTNRSYPYPVAGDTLADYPVTTALQELAEAVDDDITANLEPVAPQPRAWGNMRSNGVQTIQRNIETPLTYQLQYNDTDNMVNVVTQPTLLTINTAGLYMFHFLVTVPDTNWTNLVLRMKLNGSTEVYVTDQEFRSGAQSTFEYTTSWLWPMAVGDTMTVTLQHNSSGPLWVPARQFMGIRMAA